MFEPLNIRDEYFVYVSNKSWDMFEYFYSQNIYGNLLMCYVYDHLDVDYQAV